MKRITRRLLAAGIGGVAAIGMISVPAGIAAASPAQHAGVGIRGGIASLARLNISMEADHVFAGYLADIPKGVTSMTASFTVPSVTCPAASEISIGDAIYDTKRALQAGADVIIDCSGSGAVPEYAISSLTATTFSPTIAVQAGDSITVSDTETTSTTTATSTDETAGTSATAQDATGSSGNPSEAFSVGLFDDVELGSIPTFGTITFSGVQPNGQNLSKYPLTRSQLKVNGQLLVRTDFPQTGLSFLLIFKNNI